MDIDSSPQVRQAYELCLKIEQLPASQLQTEIVIAAGEQTKLIQRLEAELKESRDDCPRGALARLDALPTHQRSAAMQELAVMVNATPGEYINVIWARIMNEATSAQINDACDKAEGKVNDEG